MNNIMKWLPENAVNCIISGDMFNTSDGHYVLIFIDICDFTSTTELLKDPQQSTNYLNHFFGMFEEIAQTNGFEIIAYIGDEVFCVKKFVIGKTGRKDMK